MLACQFPGHPCYYCQMIFSINMGFQKNKYFLGYEDFVDIFGGHHKIGLALGVIPMHFRVLS